MNHSAISQAIGRLAVLRGQRGSFDVTVRITDAKQVYGCLRYLVIPVMGSGSIWVDASRVQIQDKDVTI